MKRLFFLLLLTPLALAHNFWLKLDGQRATLYYGHGSDEMQYAREVVKKVSGLTSTGKPAKVSWQIEERHAVLQGQGDVAQMGAEIDEGYWTKSTEGWKNKSKREVPNALSARRCQDRFITTVLSDQTVADLVRGPPWRPSGRSPTPRSCSNHRRV